MSEFTRHPLAAIEAAVLLLCPCALMPPRPKIRIGTFHYSSKVFQAASNALRASQNVAAVPDVHSPGSDPRCQSKDLWWSGCRSAA
jgi:hypothetical protein